MDSKLYEPYASTRWRKNRFKQLQLAATNDYHILTIINPPLGENYISRLPDELLNEIIGLAVRSSDRRYPTTYTPALISSVVCKRFNQLAVPFLYHDIDFNTNSEGHIIPPGFMASRLHRTIKENPSLRPLCRSLNITVDSVKLSAEDFHIAVELLFWLKNVRSFMINGGFLYGMETWPMLYHAFKYMPLITELSINRRYSNLILSPILAIKLPNLQSLRLSGVEEALPETSPRSLYVVSETQQVSFSSLP
jgi:hypothetical protein